MKVYVVLRTVDWEGTEVRAVFEDRVDALNFCKVQIEKQIEPSEPLYDAFHILIGYKILDLSYTIEEFEILYRTRDSKT